MEPVAYYFGCPSFGSAGHFLHDMQYRHVDERTVGLPWHIGLLDTGLLDNGKHRDVVDGKVFWTCAKQDWFAFFWWDRSGDSRGNSNSGFYVRGFQLGESVVAFQFALNSFPAVVGRQAYKLELQP